MDFNELIGLEENSAKEILKGNGFENIKTVINAKEDEKCNKLLVCAVKQTEDVITLICGKFYIIGE